MILMCDFSQLPEADMGRKMRPVIVLSPPELNTQTALIVPLSHATHKITKFDVPLRAVPLPWTALGQTSWAFISKHTRVHHRHLDRVKLFGRFCVPYAECGDFQSVIAGMLRFYEAAQSGETERTDANADSDAPTGVLVAARQPKLDSETRPWISQCSTTTQ